MVDDVTIDNGGLADFEIKADELAGKLVQYIKLMSGANGSTEVIEGTAANGLEVDPTRLPALTAGDAVVGRVKLTDGTTVVNVLDLANANPIPVAVVNGAGDQVTSFAGSGGTSSTDDADFTPASTAGTPIMGAFESSPSSVTDTDMGVVGITATREMKVAVTASSLDVAHGLADAGNPVLVGSRAVSVLPTRVDADDRARDISDRHGRKLVAHVDADMQVWKSFNATTTQTGANIWVPAAGKKIAITHLDIASYGTTAARCILWFAATGTTAYVEATHQPAFKGSFAPSATAKPGGLPPLPHPIFCTTADFCFKITTDAAMSVDVVVYGYEWV